ncbi:DUF937 domain-containing protein [Deinococcus soli (ex Cha et al. 2016)]|uniref:DUF937 domain-containing protein n=1 Tax=Deinococcus soli (ex Cha et al. 2016) TaxID=1309411 RepID=A0A0F7JM08_9DEIO|nr:DUF937 domain-containing protein [Deinococcus soli (ex Cha et al. 2016)]AKH17336.1 hypothetical protein SY84_10140 [Deinococcus soli (ex Cha et al. 2016)]
MNFTELLHSFFDEPATTELGRVAGLDPAAARRVLETGLPLQLDALAAQAGTPGGAHIAEAIDSLPRFESVQGALNEPDGAQNLQQAGELLMPALLGDRAGDLTRQVSERTGVDAGGAGRLMQMSLPLLLSLLGRSGVTAGNVGPLLGGLRGTLAGGLGGASAGLSGPASGLSAPAPSVPGLDVTPAPVEHGTGSAGLDAAGLAALSGPALLDWLRAQFSGKTADALGAAAGFTGGASGRAAQATLPVLLSAFVQRARTDAGAQDLLARSAASADLIGADGTLNTRVLTDPAETARVEGQGRGLLGSLFPNLDPVTGRLGSALGGSGASAGRLLALMAPMLLGLLGARARAGGLNAAAFRGLLSGLDGHLTGLLPAGLGSLGALLGAGALTGAAATPAASAPPRAAAPVVTTAPVSPPPPPAAAPVTAERRGGFPWWIIPLLLLLGLGGCWLVNQNRAAPPAATGEAAASIVVTNPTSGADLPAEPFTMSGTGPANTELTISDQGQEVGKATVGADGAWSAELPAPTTGEHTYSVDGGGGRSELKVNVTDASAGTEGTGTDTGSTDTSTDTGGTDTGSTDTGSTDAGAAAGTFAISAPAADATLPAGTFTLRGTGTAGQEVELFEDDTSLGKLTIGEDGAWSFDVPSPTAGAHTYTVRGPDGTDLGSVAATVSAPAADASAADCTEAYTLSITDGQTVNEPFRFGGVGQGEGYSVTVKRGERTIGTKDIPLDATCGWSYQSKPGAGQITYEVRPLGDAAAAPLSTVNLTVGQ